LLDRLDEAVATAGGRVYLAKDSRVRPDVLARMYPKLAEFRELRAEIDPAATLVSDLSRRLHL
jgi:decaprenylphospho-beta-D-ribofuranose 2-oxidase